MEPAAVTATSEEQIEALKKAQQIDKSRFDKEVKAVGLLIPCRELAEAQKSMGDQLLLLPRLKCIRAIEEDSARKCLLLRADCDIDKVKAYAEAKSYAVTEELVKLTYDNMTMNEVLKELLPEGVEEVPSGFETIGDIAHLNLTGKLFEQRYLIGQVVLEKNPIIRTVVTKVGQIESTFRFYDLECIAGDGTSYESEVLEDKVKFKVDVSKVYWCSKLGSERNRMIDKILQKGDVLCDMFCGIGPLAVKAAVKKGIRVLANDLNPACYEYLQKNIKLNKVDKLVIPFNMDAREFVKSMVSHSSNPDQTVVPEAMLRFDHCYMNLPVDAVEFLDAFIGLFRGVNPKVWSDQTTGKLLLPMIHVYGFTFHHEEAEARDYFVERIGKAMNFPEFSADHLAHFHNIRTVSPQSIMYGVSFRLPKEVALADPVHFSADGASKDDRIYEEFEDKSRMKMQKK